MRHSISLVAGNPDAAFSGRDIGQTLEPQLNFEACAYTTKGQWTQFGELTFEKCQQALTKAKYLQLRFLIEPALSPAKGNLKELLPGAAHHLSTIYNEPSDALFQKVQVTSGGIVLKFRMKRELPDSVWLSINLKGDKDSAHSLLTKGQDELCEDDKNALYLYLNDYRDLLQKAGQKLRKADKPANLYEVSQQFEKLAKGRSTHEALHHGMVISVSLVPFFLTAVAIPELVLLAATEAGSEATIVNYISSIIPWETALTLSGAGATLGIQAIELSPLEKELQLLPNDSKTKIVLERTMSVMKIFALSVHGFESVHLVRDFEPFLDHFAESLQYLFTHEMAAKHVLSIIESAEHAMAPVHMAEDLFESWHHRKEAGKKSPAEVQKELWEEVLSCRADVLEAKARYLFEKTNSALEHSMETLDEQKKALLVELQEYFALVEKVRFDPTSIDVNRCGSR